VCYLSISGRQSVHVPEAHIQIFVQKFKENTEPKFSFDAFRTDGYYVTEWKTVPEGLKPVSMIPMSDYLIDTYSETAELEVPDHIVEYAVRSEQRRRETVDQISTILESSVANRDPRAGFTELMREMSSLEEEEPDLNEEEIAQELLVLVTKIEGGGFH
jgi:hypothetical protein